MADYGDVLAVQGDVSSPQQVAAMLQQVEQQLGCVDILINNAGFAQQKLFTDITVEEWRKMLAVHLDGAFYCCQGVLGLSNSFL